MNDNDGFYLQRAAVCRLFATRAVDEDLKERWLHTAEVWEAMAADRPSLSVVPQSPELDSLLD
jgi:hypothetical protein